MLDKGARELGIDPLEIRTRNYIQAQDYPYAVLLGRVYDSGDPQGQHDQLLTLSDYAGLCEERQRLRASGAIVGLGVAAYTDQAGIGPSRIEKGGDDSGAAGTWESGRVEVLANARAIVSVGTHSHGQGHDITFRQVTADALGIPIEHISFQQGDSDRVSSNFGTGAQRSLTSAGMALHVAGKRIVVKGKCLAAHLFEASELDVDYQHGDFKVAGTDKTLPFSEIARMAYRGADYPAADFDLGLDETVRYDPGEDTYPTGIHLAMVTIDEETGVVSVNGYWTVNDCGVRINPLVVDGQIHGGVVQGIGQALYEQIYYDQEGQLLSGSLMDYNLPKADVLPHLELGFQETPSPANALGVKGVGECGVTGAPGAIANAVMDALCDFGVSHLDPPFTPLKIWAAIRVVKQGSS